MSYQHSIIYLFIKQSVTQSINLWHILVSSLHVLCMSCIHPYICKNLFMYYFGQMQSVSLQWRCCTVFSGHISQFCRNALTKHSKYCSLSATYFPTLTLSSINLCFPWMRKDRMSGESVCGKKEG